MKKKISLAILLLTLLLLIAGCGKQGVTYATIGGKYKVTQADVDAYLVQINVDPSQVTAEQKVNVINNLIYIKLLDFMGTKEGYNKSEEFKTTMAQQTDGILLQVAMKKYISDAVKVTPQDIKAAYEKQKADLIRPKQAVVYSISVSSKAQAQAIITQLKGKSGSDLSNAFQAIAKEKSLDTATASQGGLLGTSTQSELTPAYAPIFNLTSPGVYATPIYNQGNWNVVMVTQFIAPQTLTLEQASSMLKSQLEQEKYQAQLVSWQANTLKKLGSENEANVHNFVSGSATITSGDATVYATIAGKAVTGGDIYQLISEAGSQQQIPTQMMSQYIAQICSSPASKLQLLNQVVLNKLLIAQANKDKLQNSKVYKKIYAQIASQALAMVTQQKDIIDKIEVSDAQAQAFYNQYSSQIAQPYAQVKSQIVQMIQQQEAQQAMLTWFETNKAKYVKINKKVMPQLPASGGATTSGDAN